MVSSLPPSHISDENLTETAKTPQIDRRNKIKLTITPKFIAIITALPCVYIVLSLLHVAGVGSESGGAVYRLIIVGALIFACVHVSTHALRREGGVALLEGALALGLIAVNEVFYFAYIYLLEGSHTDLTVAFYSRVCAYMFFMATFMVLLPDREKRKNRFEDVASVVSGIMVAVILYAVIVDNGGLLYLTVLLLTVLCAVPALYLLSKGGDKLFILSVLGLIFLDLVRRLVLAFSPDDFGGHWYDITMSFYPVIHLLIGFSLVRIGSPAQSAQPVQPTQPAQSENSHSSHSSTDSHKKEAAVG
ncbi:MAG: hypothetical protein FWH32_07650 [Clostridiales bacterium]|nr:hypothetical protein [Clostridiales bacterium]